MLKKMITWHSRLEQGDRLNSEDRAWDHVEISFVTKTKKKNYQNQYLMWGIWSILTPISVTFLVIFWKKIYEIEFDKDIYETNFPYYLGFYSSLRHEY